MSHHTPRTRENFPHMKDRAAGRRIARERAAWRRGLDAAGTMLDQLRNAFDRLSSVVVDTFRAINRALTRIQSAFYVAARQTQLNNRIRWVATHQLPAAPSPWAAPVQCTER